MTEHRSAAVASMSIRMALARKSFRARDVADRLDDPPSDRTIRRVLRQLEADGWISRDVEAGHLWKPGPAADGPIISI